MNKIISLNEMREAAGRTIFGNDWLGGVSNSDWKLIKGDYGVRSVSRGQYRSPHVLISVLEIQPCPKRLAAKLDRAIGRAERANAQYSTVDSWLEEHGFPVDPREGANRAKFNMLIKKLSKAKPIAARKRGPKAKEGPRIEETMLAEIRADRLSVDDLRAMPDKELEFRFKARRTSVRAARDRVLRQLAAKKK